MKKELELQLIKKYPKIFINYGGNAQKTCMSHGMSCGDGWYNILDKLCEELTRQAPFVAAAQVKEKFGSLRFYIEPLPEATNEQWNTDFDTAIDITIKYEKESLKTCEHCGEPGEPRGTQWRRVLCDECESKIKDND